MELKFVFALFVTLASVVNADQCVVGKQVLENDNVSLSDCKSLPCQLRRKTTASVEVKFTPTHDITNLKNSVHADILGVPFPFVGVDGTSICGKIYDAKTGSKVECPLKKGTEYVYRDEFKVLEAYPKIKVLVKWALLDQDKGTAFCFHVPAKIT